MMPRKSNLKSKELEIKSNNIGNNIAIKENQP